jgi:hypothetical protein
MSREVVVQEMGGAWKRAAAQPSRRVEAGGSSTVARLRMAKERGRRAAR